MKSKKSIKKMAEGGPYPIGEIFNNKAKKTKEKSTSSDENYKIKRVTKRYTGPDVVGTKEKIKTRRTAKGILRGAEPGTVVKNKSITKRSDRTGIIPQEKYGGVTKKKKK